MNRHRPYCSQPAENPDKVIRADTRDTWRLPDNFVQAPGFTQSYNRYSYCLNNPLRWVDPSGELSFNDWYIDSKRNLQWFESTSDYVEVNGEIYSRVGSTVIRFSINGQKIYGDEHGGIHYLYPLDEVVIGKAKQQEAISSSEIEIGFKYPQSSMILLSNVYSVAGLKMEQSYSTFSLTDSRGKLNIRYYESGWLGNQYVTTYSTAQVGKYVNASGSVLGAIDAMYSFYKAVQSESVPERLCYGLDGTMDIVGMSGPLGILLALNYNIQIKNYPTIQKEVQHQHHDRNDMIRKGYFPIGYPGMPFR